MYFFQGDQEFTPERVEHLKDLSSYWKLVRLKALVYESKDWIQLAHIRVHRRDSDSMES